MFFIVAGDKIYKETKNDDEKYPLVKISISADNAVTVTEEDEGVEAFPKNYYRASIKEVIAMFGITSESGYKPPATIRGRKSRNKRKVTIPSKSPLLDNGGVEDGTN